MLYIKDVYLFTNGMVSVFDNNGEQVTDLQGKISEMRDKVIDRSSMHTVFHISKWNDWAHIISRDEFCLLTTTKELV